MNLVGILGFLKAILPTKKIAAWILGLIAAVVAIVMGVNASDLKAQYCANQEVVTIPALPTAQPSVPAPPVPSPKPVVAEKSAPSASVKK
jgi:hypothetical protein